MRRIVCALAVLGAVLCFPPPAPARILYPVILSLREEAAAAPMVLFGTLANPRFPGGQTPGLGTTDLHVQTILKGSPDVECPTVVELPRYIPFPDPRNPPPMLVFVDVFKGKLDPYRGVPVQSAAVVDYLRVAMALDPKKTSALLSYFFRHLDHADAEIAEDALFEFTKANYLDVPAWAKDLPADKIARWLEQPKLSTARVRLYAVLLGNCGKDQHAALLRRLLDEAREQFKDSKGPGIDALLLGYTILRPREGWAYLRGILEDAGLPDLIRLQARAALRSLWSAHPGLVSQAEMLGGMLLLLNQGDLADLAAEDLRRWMRWELTEQVLDCYPRKSHAAPVIRNAIIRYALSCPEGPKVKMFLEERRKAEPQQVKELEEELAQEKAARADSRLP